MNEKDYLIDLLIHDLKGPLSVASASVASLLNKTDRHTIERIWRNTRKAQALLQEMLEILRSEHGLFREERFPIAKALRESLLDAVEIVVSPLAEGIRRAKDEQEFRRILEEQGTRLPSFTIKGRFSRSCATF